MPSTSVAISKSKPGKPRPALAIVALVPGCDGADPLGESIVEDPDGRKEVCFDGKVIQVRAAEKRQRRVDTLLQLRDAGKIEDYQYTAGRNFQEDCQHAELRVRSSGDIRVGAAVAYFGISDAKLVGIAASSRAKARVKSALGRLGHRAELFALRVLIDRWAPTEAALENGWRPDTAIASLRLILDVLDRFYAEPAGGT